MPSSGSLRGSQACLRVPSVGPSRRGHLGSALHLSLCPGLQCLGLCSRGSLSHACEFEARPAAPSAGKGAAFAAGSVSPTAAAHRDNDNASTTANATTMTRPGWLRQRQRWPRQHSATTAISTRSQHLGHNDDVIATTTRP